jgi:mono/diheme cytochrome c family protein
MRTNSLSFALTVGMGLIVILMCYAMLSAAGLVGFAAEEEKLAINQQEEGGCGVSMSPAVPVATVPNGASAEIVAGETLFRANCTQCHAVGEIVVGPALAGITKRRPVGWIIPWVKNSAKVVASGDEYAVALYNRFSKQQMPSFQLSGEEIKNIVAYIEFQEGAVESMGSADQAVAAN